MSYQALYRVWRPQTFDELVGQPLIRQTLKNAVKHEQLSHAYLFTGPRGTGKTSVAKILAKAVNCLHPVDGNPDNQCEMCQLINSDQLADVLEIDAASNNGVDEIRDLRDNVRYAATQAKYKVYIIDEVHMLTTGAFNALLKTLEEPPNNVIFILATTEPHKIPATIISRTQRFDFKRISEQDIVGRLKEVLDHDNVDFDEEALAIIARASNGGLRDALSFLDQALSLNVSKITVEEALQVSGSLDQIDFVDYIVALDQNDAALALEKLTDLFEAGKQANRFVEELILFTRDLIVTRYTKHNHTLLSQAELESLKDIETSFFYQLIDGLSQAQDKMRFATQRELYVEVLTVQLATQTEMTEATPSVSTETPDLQPLIQQIHELNQQVASLQKEVDQADRPTTDMEAAPTTAPTPEKERTPRQRPDFSKNVYQEDLRSVYQVLNESTHEDIGQFKAQWQMIVDQVSRQTRIPLTGSEPLAASQTHVLISLTNQLYAGTIQQDEILLTELYHAIDYVLGHGYDLVFTVQSDWQHIRKNYVALRQNNQNKPINLETLNFPDVSLPKPDKTKHHEPVQEPTNKTTQEVQQTNVNSAPQEPLNEEVDETPEEEPLPEYVSKAIEIFGDEHVNIIYETEESILEE